MKYVLESLELFVKKVINSEIITDVDNKAEFTALSTKVKRLERLMRRDLLSQPNEVLLKSYFTTHVQKLVELCDLLFEHDLKQNDNNLNLSTLILNLIASLKQAMPQLVSREIALPKVFRLIQAPALINEWQELVLGWRNMKFDPLLIEIARLPLDEFRSSKRKLSRFHFVWLKKYLLELSKIEFAHYDPYPEPSHLIIEVLIRMDFNHIRFTAYCERVMKENAELFETKEEQLFVLEMAKKVVGQLKKTSLEPFYDDAIGVAESLFQWVYLEAEFRSRFDAEIFEIQGNKVPVNPYKHVYNFIGEQLAYWHKLQLDHKVYEEENLDIFCDKIAYNSSTKNQEDLSPRSIKSKLYLKDKDLLMPIYHILKNMLDDIAPFVS